MAGLEDEPQNYSIMGYTLGLYWDNGKENGNYYSIKTPTFEDCVLFLYDMGFVYSTTFKTALNTQPLRLSHPSSASWAGMTKLFQKMKRPLPKFCSVDV